MAPPLAFTFARWAASTLPAKPPDNPQEPTGTMPYHFTSESVSEGHPDKVADQISDAILDAVLALDPEAKVACETFVTTGLVVIGGEIKVRKEAKADLDFAQIARDTIKKIGYTRAEYHFDAESCGVMVCLHEQSAEINQGVDRGDESQQGAGDQGMMFGYATSETDNYMPLSLELSHLLVRELAHIRKNTRQMPYLRPDAKAQVTIVYDDNHQPMHIDSIVVSTQHDEDFDGSPLTSERIQQDIVRHLIPHVQGLLPERLSGLWSDDIKYHVNPTGKFVIGGPHGDTGLTGRKIIVDTYGGRGAHGGGAFSGKDPSKVDRSAAYAARHMAKNIVAAGVADQVLVQVAYAIGVVEPVSINLTTFRSAKIQGPDGSPIGDEQIAEKIKHLFDMKPGAISKRLGLKKPIYSPSAAYGHMGREPREITYNAANGSQVSAEAFTWEKLDRVGDIRKAFGLE